MNPRLNRTQGPLYRPLHSDKYPEGSQFSSTTKPVILRQSRVSSLVGIQFEVRISTSGLKFRSETMEKFRHPEPSDRSENLQSQKGIVSLPS